VLSEVAAVNGIVDAARDPERWTVDGTKATAPARVAVVFTQRDIQIEMFNKANWMISLSSMLLLKSRDTQLGSVCLGSELFG